MDDRIQDYMNRPRQYYNIDGVGEIGMGVMLLGYMLLVWLQTTTPKTSLWNQWYGFLPYIFLMSAAIHYGSRAIKTRITYPRTGFVAYRRGPRSWLLPAIAGSLAAVACSLAMRRLNGAAVMGLIVVPSYAYGIARTVEWKWIVVLVFAAGSLAISMVPGGFFRILQAVGDLRWRRLSDIGRNQFRPVSSEHRTPRAGNRMKDRIRNISEIDRVIHEPGRLMIAALLSAVEEADFLYLQHETGLNKGTLSSHLSRLEQAGYIEIRKTFRGKVPQTLLRLTATGRRAFEQYRKQLKAAL